jgi:hypothetical protein
MFIRLTPNSPTNWILAISIKSLNSYHNVDSYVS